MLRTNQNARIPLPAGPYHRVLRTSLYTFAGAVANAPHAAPPMTTTEFSIQRAYTTDRSTTLRWGNWMCTQPNFCNYPERTFTADK